MKRFVRATLPFTIGSMLVWYLLRASTPESDPQEAIQAAMLQQLNVTFQMLDRSMEVGFVGSETDSASEMARSLVKVMNAPDSSSGGLDSILSTYSIPVFTWVLDEPTDAWQIVATGIDSEHLLVVAAYGSDLDDPLRVVEYDIR